MEIVIKAKTQLTTWELTTIEILFDTTWEKPNTYSNQDRWDTLSILALENKTLIGYVSVPKKIVFLDESKFFAASVNEMIVHPAYRQQQVGSKLLSAVHKINQSFRVDISIFTCQEDLIPYYQKSGWNVLKGTQLIGGTREVSFPSSSVHAHTMVRFYSNMAISMKDKFENQNIILDLDKGKLW